VTVFVEAPVLASGVELVDTPGTGSVFQWDAAAAHRALGSMDAAVFVLAADPPVSASGRDLLGKVGELSVMTFAALNKADHLDAAELAEAVGFTGRVLTESGHPGRLYPMSARAALDGGDPGDDLRAKGIAAAALFKPSMGGWIVWIYPGGFRQRPTRPQR
jgi:translation elongation factor EF-Tu-like GTPase